MQRDHTMFQVLALNTVRLTSIFPSPALLFVQGHAQVSKGGEDQLSMAYTLVTLRKNGVLTPCIH